MAKKRGMTKRRSTGSRRSRFHRKPKMTVSMAIVAGFSGPVVRVVNEGRAGGPQGAVKELSRIMIGVDPTANPPTFQPYLLRYGAFPVLVGFAAHKVANMLGLNRMIARAGVPVIRI